MDPIAGLVEPLFKFWGGFMLCIWFFYEFLGAGTSTLEIDRPMTRELRFSQKPSRG